MPQCACLPVLWHENNDTSGDSKFHIAHTYVRSLLPSRCHHNDAGSKRHRQTLLPAGILCLCFCLITTMNRLKRKKHMWSFGRGKRKQESGAATELSQDVASMSLTKERIAKDIEDSKATSQKARLVSHRTTIQTTTIKDAMNKDKPAREETRKSDQERDTRLGLNVGVLLDIIGVLEEYQTLFEDNNIITLEDLWKKQHVWDHLVEKDDYHALFEIAAEVCKYPHDWAPNDELPDAGAERILKWLRLLAKIKEEHDDDMVDADGEDDDDEDTVDDDEDTVDADVDTDADGEHDDDSHNENEDEDNNRGSLFSIMSSSELATVTSMDVKEWYMEANDLDKRDLFNLAHQNTKSARFLRNNDKFQPRKEIVAAVVAFKLLQNSSLGHNGQRRSMWLMKDERKMIVEALNNAVVSLPPVKKGTLNHWLKAYRRRIVFQQDGKYEYSWRNLHGFCLVRSNMLLVSHFLVIKVNETFTTVAVLLKGTKLRNPSGLEKLNRILPRHCRRFQVMEK